jgi:hypothetical protein
VGDGQRAKLREDAQRMALGDELLEERLVFAPIGNTIQTKKHPNKDKQKHKQQRERQTSWMSRSCSVPVMRRMMLSIM